MPSLDLSVVIPFRDWGIERLQRSVASLHDALYPLEAEIIISDYGSADPTLSKEVAREAGARWISTPGDPVWSRSRALNAGFSIADGDILVATDADMLFAPGTMAAIHAEATAAAPCAVFLQCRDLPADLHVALDDPWDYLESRSRLRPRWGMGGLMAIDREGFSLLHGFDERLHTYGREDLDFALRARRAGRRTHWAQGPRARMYHMWHPPTADIVQATDEGRRAVVRNRQMVDSDPTTSRNVAAEAPLSDGRPLVSIVVTNVEHPDDLHRTVVTALAQSVRDLEVVVCERGGDQTSLRVDDPRVRRHRVDGSISIMSEEALTLTHGAHLSVVRCGDLLPPDSIERLLAGMIEGTSGVSGRTAVAHQDGSVVMDSHPAEAPSLLLRRQAVRALGTALRAGHAFQLSPYDAIGRAGLEIATSDATTLLTLRTSPAASTIDSAIQESDAAPLRALLPDDHPGAVARSAHVRRIVDPRLRADHVFDGTVTDTAIRFGDDVLQGGLTVRGATYSDLAVLAQGGHGLMILPSTGAEPDSTRTWIDRVVEHALSRSLTSPLEIRREHIPISDAESSDVYIVHSQGDELAVRIASRQQGATEDRSEPTERPWILIGSDIEEHWS